MFNASYKVKVLYGFACITIILAIVGALHGCKSVIPKHGVEHVYSHRGASGEEIEHTIAAYDLAVLYGSKYIEQDVVLSADGTPWISHDSNAKRITGTDSDYSTLTDEQIEQLRTKDGQHILKLDEVFSRYDGQVVFVVELRGGPSGIEAFSELVRKYDNENCIIVQSANIDVLRQLADTFPEMRQLLLLKDMDELEYALEEECVDIISVSKEHMTEDVCEMVHAHDKLLNVWTLDSTEEIRDAININVDSYFTDYTAKALALEEKYRD